MLIPLGDPTERSEKTLGGYSVTGKNRGCMFWEAVGGGQGGVGGGWVMRGGAGFLLNG